VEFTRRGLASAIGARNAEKLQRLSPGVDAAMFRPGLGAQTRTALGLDGRPVVVCVSRLMPRKGQDVLIRALPVVQREVPDAALLLVGGGPSRRRLEALASSYGVQSSVVFTGTVPWAELPHYYGAGDVFAMPCRSRLGGVDVEGLGIVFLEAAACGLPVIAGDSGGAPEAVQDGVTGHVVDGRAVEPVAARLVELLHDSAAAAAMGERGREWVTREWSWDAAVERLRSLL
jgi:phosphatidylinositol alpha-1,6-mannosyltransferase